MVASKDGLADMHVQLVDNLSALGLGMARDKVTLVPHSSDWAKAYSLVAEQLAALTHSTLTWHHVGSTSVAGIAAKPILDILGVTDNIHEIDRFRRNFESLGFTWKGEYGIAGRRYCVLYDAEEKIGYVHLHIFENSNPEVEKHLIFRDYLRTSIIHAKEYETCKQQLQSRFSQNRERYTAGKDNLITRILDEAYIWRKTITSSGCIIRYAATRDALAVAKTNISGWLKAYRGIMPDSLLNALEPATRVERFLGSGFPTYPNGTGFTIVAEMDGVIVGYVQGGPPRDQAGADSEIYAIYMNSDYIGKGIGKWLFDAGRSELRQGRYSNLAVWVLEANSSARRFYERQGGQLSGLTKEKDFGGKLLTEVAYQWKLS